MAKPNVIEVVSLSSFTKCVEEALKESRAGGTDDFHRNNWYRGHGLRSFSLKPSLYRHPKLTKSGDLLDLESRMIREFRRQGTLHDIPSLKKHEDEQIDTLCYMQHYGVPTRLLDWTSNPFIALYFALTDAERAKTKGKYSQPASVWILNPWAWNQASLDQVSYGEQGPVPPDSGTLNSYLPRLDYDASAKAGMYEDPVAILGTANNARMFAQKGVFTIFGKSTDPMDKIFNSKNYPPEALIELVVKEDYIETLLKDLLCIGYTDSVAYPDHQGLALEIKRMNGFQA